MHAPVRYQGFRRSLSRRRLLRSSAAGSAGLAGLWLAACGGDNEETSESGSTGGAGSLGSTAAAGSETKKTGGTLRVSNTESPPSLDPYVYITQHAQAPSAIWYSRLFRYQHGAGIKPRQYEVEPEVATAQPELTDGGQTMIVKLRKDVMFHDRPPVNGRLLTAEDVSYTVERFRAVSPRASVLGKLDKLEAPDPETLVFRLKSPSASFLSSLTDGSFLHIVPKELVDPAKQHATKGNPVGSGPWIFDAYEENVAVRAVANPKYFRGRPAIDKLEWSIIPETATAVSAFRSGRLDILRGIPEAEVDSVRSVKDVNIIEYPGGSLLSMNFDLTGVFSDVRLRRAVSMAIDRDAISETNYGGKGQPSTIFAPGYAPWFLDPKGNGYGDAGRYLHFDAAGAKALMQQAGYNGQEVKFNSSPNLNEEHIELLASMLAKVGFKVKIELREYAAFLETTNKGAEMGGGIGYIPYAHYPDPSSFLDIYWDPKSVNLKTRYTDEQVGQMIAAQDRALETDARAKIIHDIQRRFADQQYTTFLVNGPAYVGIGPKLRDYNHLDNVYGVEGYADAWLA